MTATSTLRAPRRNKGFAATHVSLIDLAIRLISEKGIEALSIAELARAAGVNRTTIYYHFDSREALVAAVREWSSQQLAKAFAPIASERERAAYIIRFVLENPDLIRLWIEDFLSPGDIRTRYPEWDGLVAGIDTELKAHFPSESIDPEVYCVNMLTTAMVAPRVFHDSVRPELDIEDAIERLTGEQLRALRRDGLVR